MNDYWGLEGYLEHPDFLEPEEVIAIHDEVLIGEYGGIPGFRDYNLLESCVCRPVIYFKYEGFGISDIAAAYMFCINQSHAFLDGNKRTSLFASEQFLRDNGYVLSLSKDDERLENIAIEIAKGCCSLEEVREFMKLYAVSAVDYVDENSFDYLFDD